MIRYPFTLEMWYEEDAMQDQDTGQWIEGEHEWRVVGRCNVRQNGQARMVRGENGEAFLYAYEVLMPWTTSPIPFNTEVRVFDRDGINVFNHKPITDTAPVNGDSASYPVRGFYKSGQRNQDVTIWL